MRGLIAVVGFAAASAAVAQADPGKPNPWFAVPAGAVFTTGDTWTYAGETHRLYGVQSCLRGTAFTNAHGRKVDCGEASLTMLVSLIRDLKPVCSTTGWRAETKTRFLVCVAQPKEGSAAGSRIDLGTALVSTGWAFAALNPDGKPVHAPYLVAQAVARKQRAGLWQFDDVPDPNDAILRRLQAATDLPVAPRLPIGLDD